MEYNLENRVLAFGSTVITFLKSVEITIWTENIIRQLLKSATSVGANYYEANWTLTKKEFANRISICRREIKETIYRLQIIKHTKGIINWYEEIYQEARELMYIFNKIAKTLRETKE